MTSSAKQSGVKRVPDGWIASSLPLLAMTSLIQSTAEPANERHKKLCGSTLSFRGAAASCEPGIHNHQSQSHASSQSPLELVRRTTYGCGPVSGDSNASTRNPSGSARLSHSLSI